MDIAKLRFMCGFITCAILLYFNGIEVTFAKASEKELPYQFDILAPLGTENIYNLTIRVISRIPILIIRPQLLHLIN